MGEALRKDRDCSAEKETAKTEKRSERAIRNLGLFDKIRKMVMLDFCKKYIVPDLGERNKGSRAETWDRSQSIQR